MLASSPGKAAQGKHPEDEPHVLRGMLADLRRDFHNAAKLNNTKLQKLGQVLALAGAQAGHS